MSGTSENTTCPLPPLLAMIPVVSLGVVLCIGVLDLLNAERTAAPFVGVGSNALAQALGIGIHGKDTAELVAKYGLWCSIFVVEVLDGHLRAFHSFVIAILAFSFTMDVGINAKYKGFLYCCSSYSYLHICGVAHVASAEFTRRKKLTAVSWSAFLILQVAYDSWRWDHHALSFVLGSGLRALLVGLPTPKPAWGIPCAPLSTLGQNIRSSPARASNSETLGWTIRWRTRTANR